MKKYTCKMTPQNNEDLKAEQYEIELEECCNECPVWKYILIGAVAAFCMGMAIAFFAWTSQLTYNLKYWPDHNYLYAMIVAIVTLTIVPTICATVLVFKAISKKADTKRRLEKRLLECAAKKCAGEAPEQKKEKGINFKISKF